MMLRRVLLVGALVVAGAGLAGCEKPAPAVTVFSGTSSVRASALCWSHTGEALDNKQCSRDILTAVEEGPAPRLKVRPGNVVGISVDPAIAERGWVPIVAGQRLVERPITETYYRFTFPSLQLPEKGVGLQVSAGGSGDLLGLWAVRLVE